jgi:hypothetical protein
MLTSLRPSICRCALVAAVLALGASPLAVASPFDYDLAGTWAWTTFVAPETGIPALVTYEADGTIVGSDSTMFGSFPALFPFKMTPFHGVWSRLGLRRFGGTSLMLLFDASSSDLVGFGRSRSAIRLDDRNHISGAMFLEMLPCPTPLSCPDPADPAGSWVPLGDPENGFPFEAVRLQRVPTP